MQFTYVVELGGSLLIPDDLFRVPFGFYVGHGDGQFEIYSLFRYYGHDLVTTQTRTVTSCVS